MSNFIHPTANIEKNVCIGSDSSIWEQVHIRHDSRIGDSTSIGEKTYIAYDVTIGNYVKINAMVYICTGVTIEDMCMISAGTVFTNDLLPRAMNKQLTALETSDPTEETLLTVVKQGATIGANCTIGPGISIGRFAMIGMGAVVTKDIPDFALVVGNPAKVVGYVCSCGKRILNNAELESVANDTKQLVCHNCDRNFIYQNNIMRQGVQ